MTAIPEIQPDKEIITRRTLSFPRSLVYSAWSDPNRLKRWWGPSGFTNTFEEFDFRPGGRWKFIMHGPDKGNYNNECEFIQIEKPKLIFWKRHSKPLFQVAVTFEEVTEESTDMTFRMIFESKEECDKLKKFVVDKNEENFDRLETELQKMI
jgi:uncharacterized protein YndB with AHSA1/START domain